MKKIFIIALFLTLMLGTASLAFGQALQGTLDIPSVGYPTIASAISALNANGVGAGGVLFRVAADHTETTTGELILTATGTVDNPIEFRKVNTGNSPKITRTDGGSLSTSTLGGQGDAVLIIEGSDYVTFDGIDIAADQSGIEYGYYLRKASATDACKNVTIKNAIVTMNKGAVAWVTGIYVSNNISTSLVSSATGVTVTSEGGRHENITIIGNTVQNVHVGIMQRGFAASSPYNFYDQNIVIGQSGAPNTIRNFGGGNTANTYGIFTMYAAGQNVSYNTVANAAGGGTAATGPVYGIFTDTAVSVNTTVNNNTITLTGGGNTHAWYGIYNTSGSTAASNTININYNVITGTYPTATSGALYGIWNSASAATVNMNYNEVKNISYSAAAIAGSGSIYPIYSSGSATTVNATYNLVDNITRTGNSGGSTIGIYLSAGTNQYANNNTITNMSIDGTGTGSLMYGIQTSGTTVTMNNNVINTLRCLKTTGTGALYGLYNFSSPTNENYNNNTIHTLTHAGTGTVYGIHVNTSAGTRTMSGNIVYNLSTVGTTIAGLSNATSSPSIFKNKIYNIQSTSTVSPLVSGIIVSSIGASGNAYIYNNFISDLKAPNANNADAIRGINLTTTSTGTVGLYYNSIYLNASSIGTNFGTCGIYHTNSTTAGSSSLDMRNNIIKNTSTPNGTGKTVAFRRSAVNANLNNYATTSNNNSFFAGAEGDNNVIFFDGTNFDANMTAFKTRVNPRETVSFREDTPFLDPSAGDLSLRTDRETQCESAGVNITTPIVITNDYFGTTRSTTPDIGAHEGNFMLLDLAPPTITYTALGQTTQLGDRTLTGVNIMDASGISLTLNKPRIYYKKGIDGTWNWAEGVNTSGTELNSNWNFTMSASAMGGLEAGNVVYYYVIAQDLAGAVNVGSSPAGVVATSVATITTPPTTPNSYTIAQAISGTISVGTGNTYTSLTADAAEGLFKAINSGVVTGNIEVLITSNLTETGVVALNQTTEEGAGNYTITIKPSAAEMRTISGAYAGGLIRLNGADRVTFDGRYSGSGKYLTIYNSSTSSPQAVTLLNAANSNTIRDCLINTNSTTGGYAIYVWGGSNGNSIVNNTITKAFYGLYVVGTSSVPINNLVVDGNYLGDAATAANSIGFIGIYTTYATNFSIANNTIVNIRYSTGYCYGIQLATGSVTGSVTKNIIDNLMYTGTGGYSGVGIDLNVGNATSNIVVANNMISRILGDGYLGFTSGATSGIRIQNTGALKLYYNSVYLTGQNTYASSTNKSAAVYIASSANNVNLDFRNNVFFNAMTHPTQTTHKSYAIYSDAPNTSYLDINNNLYYASGAHAVLGYMTADQTTLAAWQGATTKDAASWYGDPQFQSTSNLHINASVASWAEGRGQHLADYPTDIDGDIRWGSPGYVPGSTFGSDIGADEGNFTRIVQVVTPSNQPTVLQLIPAATAISGSLTASDADSYLVVRHPNATLDFSPVDQTTYTPGQSVGVEPNTGVVVSASTATSFNTTGLTAATTYYFTIFAFNNVGTGGPLYLVDTPLAGNMMTLPAAPDQPGTPFTATAVSPTQIDVVSTANGAGNNIMIARNTVNTFGTPLSTGYTVGQSITGGGTVVYIGPAGTFYDTPVSVGTQYFYSAWSYITAERTTYYSFSTSARTANAITPQVPATLPFAETFEVWPNGWTVVNGTHANKWYVGTAAAPYEGLQTAYISQDGGVSYTYNVSTATAVHLFRDVTFTSGAAEFLLDFKWKAQGEGTTSDWDNLKVFLLDTTTTPVAGTPLTTNQIGATWYNLGGADTWNSVTLSLPGTLAGTTKRLVFQWKQDGSGGAQPPVAVDNVYLTAFMTPKPTALAVGAVTGNTANLSWTSAQSIFDIQYGPIGFTLGAGTPINAVSNPYLLEGLSAGTGYDYYVRANDGVDPSTWAGPYNFYTAFALPYTTGFDATVNAAAGWWTVINSTSTSAVVNISTSSPNSPTQNIYMYNPSSNQGALVSLVSPVFNAPLNTLYARFYARGTADRNLTVGVVNTLSSAATFTPVATLPLTTTYAPYVVDFTTYAGSDQYISFRLDTTDTVAHFVYIDDVTVSTAPWDELAVTAFTATPLYKFTDTEFSFNFSVKNNGTTSSGKNVTLKMGETTIGTVAVGNLAFGATANLTYDWTPETAGTFTFTAEVPSDQNDTNNLATLANQDIFTLGQLAEGFEGLTFPPARWYRWEADGENAWERTTGSYYDGVAASGLVLNTTNTTSHLATPLLVFATTRSAMNDRNTRNNNVTFYARSTGTGHQIQCWYGETNDGREYTSLGSPITVTGTYTQYTVPGTASLNGNYHIAFQALPNGSTGVIQIDKVVGPMVYIPSEPPGFAALLSPADLAENINPYTVVLTWDEPGSGGIAEGYNVRISTDPEAYLEEDNDRFVGNGGILDIVTERSYNIFAAGTTLDFNTDYYWQIVPFSGSNELEERAAAATCEPNKFTTMKQLSAPTPLALGNSPASYPKTGTIVVTNHSTTAALTFTPSGADFTFTGTAPFTIPAGGTYDLGYTFNAPATLGAYTGTLTLTENTPGNALVTVNVTATIVPSISGTINVGEGNTYTSLTADSAEGLFKAINSGVVTGNIEVLITSNLTETGTIALNQTVEAGVGNYTITISPSAAEMRTISGAVASAALITLNGADRVTINGFFPDSRGNYLTITNTSTTAPRAIMLQNASNNNVIQNCLISTGSTTAGQAIYVQTGSNNNSILNNTITKSYYGVYVLGTSSVPINNLVIDGNFMGDAATSANSIGFIGVYTTYATNFSINQNTIVNIRYASGYCYGIQLYTGCVTGTVTNNTIDDLMYTGTGGYSGVGIDLNAGSATSNIVVANNMLTRITGDGYSGFTSGATSGIRIQNTGALKLYYNSVYLTGQNTYGSSSNKSAAIYIANSTNNVNLDIRNNIFYNAMTHPTQSGHKSYAIYSDAVNTKYAFIDYNLYYASGAHAVLGYLGSAQTTLQAWKAATTKDAASWYGDPQFTSTTNLHIRDDVASWAESRGQHLADYPTDIDGDIRFGSPGYVAGSLLGSDIGADEGSFIYVDPAVAPTAQPTALQLIPGSTTVNGSFTAADPAAEAYLVVRHTAALTASPVDGTYYSVSGALGGGVVVSVGAATSFSTSGLTVNTPYSFTVYAYSTSGAGAPAYLLTDPISGTVTTLGTPPLDPQSLSPVAVNTSQIDITTVGNSADPVDDVLLAWSADGVFGTPLSNVNYAADGEIPGGGIVLANGPAGTYNHTLLDPLTTYYYKAWSVKQDGSYYLYSSGITSNATTLATLPYSQYFDASTAWPQGWAKVGTGGSANVQASNAYSAPNTVYIYSSGSTSMATVSMPSVSVSNTAVTMSFYARSNYTTGAMLQVGYLTNPSDASTFVQISEVTTTLTYAPFNINLGVWNGVMNFAFRASYNPAYSLLFDNVVLEVPLSNDLAVTGLAGNTTAFQNTPVTHTVTVRNNGTAAQSDYTVYLKSVETRAILAQQTFAAALEPGSSNPVALEWTPANLGAIQIYGEVALTGDQNAANNVGTTLAVTVYQEGILVESFETGTIPSNWTVLNADGGTQSWNTNTAYPRTGTYAAKIRYESSSLLNDDWLITPPLQVTSGTTDDISFWMRSGGTYYVEPWEVLISTTDTNPASFTMIDSGTTALGTYFQKSYNLDSYGDAIVYLAIRYTGDDQLALYVDDFFGPLIYVPETMDVPQVTIEQIGTTLKLNWDRIPYAYQYMVYEADSPEGPWIMITPTTNNNWYTITTPGTKKFYQVRASSDAIRQDVIQLPLSREEQLKADALDLRNKRN